MPDISVDGLRYHVEEIGGGMPLVLLHGFTGSTQSWRYLIPELSNSCRVVAIDLPGHGSSGTSEDFERFEFARVIDDLAVIAQELAIGPAVWTGYSMGGRTALAFAVEHPTLVSGLILESASPGIDAPSTRVDRRKHDALLAESIERDGIPRFVADWEALPLWASQSSLSTEVHSQQRAIRLSNSARGLAGSLRGMGAGSQPSYWDHLCTVDCPVLLIAGEQDPKFVQIATDMDAALPNAHLEIVPDAGHAIHLERPQIYLSLVSQFLEIVKRNAPHAVREEVA